MARNEEKQLARLNRFYLQQQKDEELKKRPPRPKLENLATAEDVKKWIPSIIKDIEFYVKQMEVPCYRDHQIEEFNRRVDSLRGEYKAFLHKVRQLDHSLDANPWTDRPYSGKRKKTAVRIADHSTDTPEATETNVEASGEKSLSISFTPIATPVLNQHCSFKNFYGYVKPVEVLNDIGVGEISQNQPLQLSLAPASKLPIEFLSAKQETAGVSLDRECSPRNSALPSRLDDNPRDRRLNSQTEGSEQELSTELQVPRPCLCKASSCSARECVCAKSVQHVNQEAGEKGWTLRDQVTVAPTLNLPYTDSSSSDES